MNSILDQNLLLKGKKVILRVDLNVPMKNGSITEISRIVKILPTLKLLIEKEAKIIILSHIGRPKGKVLSGMSLEPISKKLSNLLNKKINYEHSTDNIIRIIKGTNFEYFSKNAIDKFFNEDFLITNLVDRMGIRLKGPKLENIENTNIKSEGLVRGVIQVPADGNPIIMLSDHGTVGGYPKIGVVIAADLDLIGQLTPGTKINFKEVSLEEAQNIFKAYTDETNRYLNECN